MQRKEQIDLKSFTFIIAIITLMISFSACERISQVIQPTTPQIEDTSSEFSIGVALPLTGHLAPAAGTSETGT